jgi:hypothetical protein
MCQKFSLYFLAPSFLSFSSKLQTKYSVLFRGFETVFVILQELTKIDKNSQKITRIHKKFINFCEFLFFMISCEFSCILAILWNFIGISCNPLVLFHNWFVTWMTQTNRKGKGLKHKIFFYVQIFIVSL